MIRNKLFIILSLVVGVSFLMGCGSRKASSPSFQSSVGDPYFDSYYLFLTDSTAASLPALRANFARSQSPEISSLIGQIFYRQGNLDSALGYIRHSYTLDSNNITYTQKYYAVVEESQSNPQLLIHLAKRLVALDSGNAKNQYSLLMAYIRNNEIDHAIRYGKERQQFFRRYFEIDRLLVNLYLQREETDSAMQLVEKLIIEEPSEADNYFLGSTIAARLDDTLRYKQYFKKGVQYGCPNEMLLSAYTQYMLLEERKPRDLLHTLDTVFSRCHYPEAWLIEMLSNLRFLFTSPRMSDSTEKHLFQSFERELAHSSEGQFLLLQYYRRNADTAAIWDCIDRNQRQFAPSYLWDMIYVSESLKYKPVPRLEEWEKATRVPRENILRYPFELFSAYVYFEWVGQATDSVRLLDSIDHYITHYKTLLQESKKDQTYTYQYSFGRDTTLYRIPTLRHNLSRLYCYKGDISIKDQKAFEAYKEALRYDPNNEIALNNYAYNLALQDEASLKRALEMSEKSLTIAPDNENYLDTYGYILYRLKRYKEAKVVFTKLLSINPNPGVTSLLHYSDILEALGNKDAAEVYRMKAARLQEEGQR